MLIFVVIRFCFHRVVSFAHAKHKLSSENFENLRDSDDAILFEIQSAVHRRDFNVLGLVPPRLLAKPTSTVIVNARIARRHRQAAAQATLRIATDRITTSAISRQHKTNTSSTQGPRARARFHRSQRYSPKASKQHPAGRDA